DDLLSRKGQQFPDHGGSAHAFVAHLHEARPRAVVDLPVLNDEMHAGEDAGENVVQVVAHTGRELADGFELLLVPPVVAAINGGIERRNRPSWLGWGGTRRELGR